MNSERITRLIDRAESRLADPRLTDHRCQQINTLIFALIQGRAKTITAEIQREQIFSLFTP